MNNSKVTVVVTAMTDAERPFVSDTLKAISGDPCLGQVLICVEKDNEWIAPIVDQHYDHRVQILYLPMMILSAARNRAVELARCEWVAFCDGDDVWCPGKLNVQLEIAEEQNADFIGTDHFLTDEDGNIKACALARFIPMPSSWLVKTSVMLEHPFDETVRQGQDGEWWVRTHQLVKKVRCSSKLLKYRVRSNSLSSKRPSKKRKALIVQLASFPILSKLVYWATYLMWYVDRRDEYLWYEKSWGDQPAVEASRVGAQLT